MDVNISELHTSRWKEYKRIRLEALKSEPLAFGSSYSEEKKRSLKDWRERLERKVPPLFALIKNEVVGMVSYKFENELKLDHIADIYAVYVSKEFRGNGIALKLLKEVIKRIYGNKKIKKIKLIVGESQKPARELYKKLGFRKVGFLRKEIHIDNRYYDNILMEKLL